MMKARLFVCTNCPTEKQSAVPEGFTRGSEMLELLTLAVGARAELGGKCSVERVKCMGGCETPCTVAMAAPGKETLLFNCMERQMVPEIVECFAFYVGMPEGHRMSRAERPEALKEPLMVRVPAAVLE